MHAIRPAGRTRHIPRNDGNADLQNQESTRNQAPLETHSLGSIFDDLRFSTNLDADHLLVLEALLDECAKHKLRIK